MGRFASVGLARCKCESYGRTENEGGIAYRPDETLRLHAPVAFDGERIDKKAEHGAKIGERVELEHRPRALS